jgi:hypothetical protein
MAQARRRPSFWDEGNIVQQARITERKPSRSHAHRRYWFVLEAVDPPPVNGEALQYASARTRRGDPTHVDPEERCKALAELNLWADGHGWTVVSEERARSRPGYCAGAVGSGDRRGDRPSSWHRGRTSIGCLDRVLKAIFVYQLVR